MVKRMKKKKKDFFHPNRKETGWHKWLPAEERRRKHLRAHGNNVLATARSLQYLSNLSQDEKTKKVADADANYFYRLHKKR